MPLGEPAPSQTPLRRDEFISECAQHRLPNQQHAEESTTKHVERPIGRPVAQPEEYPYPESCYQTRPGTSPGFPAVLVWWMACAPCLQQPSNESTEHDDRCKRYGKS